MYDFGSGMVILAKMALADVCDMDSLYQVIGNGAEERDDDGRRLVELLKREGLLKKCGRCPERSCRRQTRLMKDARYKGGYCSYCSRCRRRRSLAAGTFFENTLLSLRNVLKLLFFWALHTSVKMGVQASRVSRKRRCNSTAFSVI